MKKALNKCLIILVFAFLLCSLVKALIRPKSINYYENRPANQFPILTTAGCLDSSFQDELEAALSDQVLMAQRLEYTYHSISSNFLEHSVLKLAESYPDHYVNFRGMDLFGGNYITFSTIPLDCITNALDQKIANYNQVFAANPELQFYVYYIEKDTDIDFATGQLSGISDYVLGGLQLPEAQKAVFQVRSFEQFRNQFFRTDHHWNCQGSYSAYLQVLNMLGKEDPLYPLGTQLLASDFCGSKATVSGAVNIFQEDFYAHQYEFPPMQITIDGEPAEDYGRQNRAWNTTANGAISYGGYYGGDNGEVVFRTEKSDAGNLLVIGESYDNAILKLLASSYHNTYSIDLRYYESSIGHPFRFSEYASEHDIDTVLLIGNVDYYTMSDFLLEDGV